jgi:AcrR family transcriptional regulator
MSQQRHNIEQTGTKYKIIETALDLFSRKGYTAVSVRELTKEVGIKESSLYNHFKSKEEILESIYTLFEEERAKSLPSADVLEALAKKVSIEQFLKEGIETFKISVANDHYEKMWRILNMEQFRDQRARKIILENMYRGTIDFLESAFRAFMDAGKLPHQDPRNLAVHYQYPLFAMMTEYLLIRYDQLDTVEVEKRMQVHLEYFLENLVSSA